MIIKVKKPKSKPRKTCPKCGGKSIAKIIWGLVMLDPKKENENDVDNIHYGGCCIPIDENGNAPKYHCNDCEYEW